MGFRVEYSEDSKPSIFAKLWSGIRASSPFTAPRVDSPYRSTSSRIAQEWFPSSTSSDEALLPSLSTLRDQSRDLDRNESLARGATENYVTNVVADGLRPQARIDHELIGIPEEKAREFERRAEKLFELHMSKSSADFYGRANFPTLQAQVLRSALIDGDALVVRRYRPQPLGIMPICLQLIDGSRIKNPSAFLDPNTDIREGVELDASGMAVAYHVAKTGQDYFLGGETIRIPRFDPEGAPKAIHVYQQRLPGQSRGEPFLAPVVEKFKQISRYTEAEIMAAVLSAFYTTFVTSELGSPFGDRSTAHIARDKGLDAQRERQTKTFGPGLMVDLLPGEKVDTSSPGRPNSNFDPFVQAVIKQIGIGLGLPYEIITQHFQSSYSAARGAILEAWKAFKVRRAWLVSDFCQPVWEWVITDAVRDGLLEAPGFDDPLKRQAYFCTQWTGTEMESIDPLKEAKANEVEIDTGVRSRRSIIEGQGRDFDKHVREYQEEQKIFPDQNLQKEKNGKAFHISTTN